jgi:hypothetical protein
MSHQDTSNNPNWLYKPGRHSLGDNLYLYVRSPNDRWFIVRYRDRADGKRHDKALGNARNMTTAQAHKASRQFQKQLTERPPSESSSAIAEPAPEPEAPANDLAGDQSIAAGRRRTRKYRGFVRASTIGGLPPRVEVIEQTIRTLTSELHRLQRQVEDNAAELRRLRAVIAWHRSPTLASPRPEADQASDIIAEPATPAAIAELEPAENEFRSAVIAYCEAKVSAGEKPKKTECSQILQHKGYWPLRSPAFMYLQISRHWPTQLEPADDKLRSAIFAYYEAKVSAGERPTKSECSHILQQSGYWPRRSAFFMYLKIGPHWPGAGRRKKS